MAGVFIHITGNAFPRLQILQERGANFSTVMDDIGAFLDSDTVERFTKEQAPDGSKWEQSEAARLGRSSKKGKKRKSDLTLTDQRNLADSVTHNVTGNSLEFGLGEKYAAIHHFGGKTGRNHSVTLPSRKLIGIAAIQETEINNIITDWLI